MISESNNPKNLYVVESPLQALCALEVSLSKPRETHTIIARLADESRSKNNQQILHILRLRHWDNEIIIAPPPYQNRIFNQAFKLKQLLDIKRQFNSQVDTLYIGEFRFEFMHAIRSIVDASNVYLLDDGAATVNVIKDYLRKGKYHPDLNSFFPKGFIKRAIYKSLYGRFLNKEVLSRKIGVITAFSRQDTKYGIQELHFDNVKRIYSAQKSVDPKVVYFYGSKYSEANIISSKYELEFLKSIKEYYAKREMRIFYFPHRDESEQKLKFIAEELSFEIKKTNEIAEIYLLKSPVLPIEVAGAYTSALNSIGSIFPEVTLTSFRLNEDEVSVGYQESINNVYQYYKDIGINVVYFN